jgi:hypothetical protein
MRKIKDVKLTTITLSEVEQLKAAGFVPLEGGDASGANSDFFLVMVRTDSIGKLHVKIVCPSFLRGPLGFHIDGCVSY